MPKGSRRAEQRRVAERALRSGDDTPLRPPTGDAMEDGWVVRVLSGAGSTKEYRCPGCDHEVVAGVPHTVSWPEGQADLRRHWHSPCWAARSRRHRRG